MAVNIKLVDKFEVDTDTDSMNRTWAGWDPNASDQVIWDHNRGRHTFGSRVDGERFATLSYKGDIKLVAELTGRTQEANPLRTGQKWSLQGRVLPPGDPIREALLRLPAPDGRSTIRYIQDPADIAESNAFLLTNNPRKFQLDPDLLAGWVDATSNGYRVESTWSTGTTTKRIFPGDRAFLLRQGVSDRGIFASGTFLSRVYQDTHWDDSGTTSNYADVSWDSVLDPEDRLPIEVLLSSLPDGQWEPQSSGTQVNPLAADALEELWSAHLVAVRATPPPGSQKPAREGQGRLLDAKLRKQIEDLAQDRLADHYSDNGWTVEDLRYGNPFDAKATKDGAVVYLEAKGTTTAGRCVIVTRNEVAFAREHPGQCVMGLVSGITLTAEGDVEPSSGKLVIYAWEPGDDDLDPLTYDFYPPESLKLDDQPK